MNYQGLSVLEKYYFNLYFIIFINLDIDIMECQTIINVGSR